MKICMYLNVEIQPSISTCISSKGPFFIPINRLSVDLIIIWLPSSPLYSGSSKRYCPPFSSGQTDNEARCCPSNDPRPMSNDLIQPNKFTIFKLSNQLRALLTTLHWIKQKIQNRWRNSIETLSRVSFQKPNVKSNFDIFRLNIKSTPLFYVICKNLVYLCAHALIYQTKPLFALHTNFQQSQHLSFLLGIITGHCLIGKNLDGHKLLKLYWGGCGTFASICKYLQHWNWNISSSVLASNKLKRLPKMTLAVSTNLR